MGSTKTQKTTMDPIQQEFLTETLLPFAKDIAGTPYQSYEGERVAGMTPLQQQALSGYGNLNMGGAEYDRAAGIYGQLGEFEAPEARAARLAEAERMRSVGQVGDVTAGQLSTTNLGQYMSPYTQQVIEAGQADIERQRQLASENLAAQAQRAGAFGGSRQAVQEGVLAGEALRQAGALSAQQRQQAFESALQSGRFDIGTGMQAQQLNQQAAEAAAAREQAARSGNMAAANQFAMQQAQFEQAANLANQQAALSAAGVQATGAAGLGSIAGQQLQSQLAGLGAQMQAGEAARGLEQARLDVPYQDYMAAMQYPLTQFGVLSGAGQAFPAGIGTTTQRTGGLGPVLGAVGSAGQGLGAMGMTLPFSDVRLKENIQKVGSRNGVDLYTWEWNEKAKSMGAESMPATGVIAQEIEADYPQHIYVGNDGYRRVNYIGLFNELG